MKKLRKREPWDPGFSWYAAHPDISPESEYISWYSLLVQYLSFNLSQTINLINVNAMNKSHHRLPLMLLIYNDECNCQAVQIYQPGQWPIITKVFEKPGSRKRSYLTVVFHDNWHPRDNAMSLSSSFSNWLNRTSSLQVKAQS